MLTRLFKISAKYFCLMVNCFADSLSELEEKLDIKRAPVLVSSQMFKSFEEPKSKKLKGENKVVTPDPNQPIVKVIFTCNHFYG